jgi:D-alanyl-D-alanine dipeptidase
VAAAIDAAAEPANVPTVIGAESLQLVVGLTDDWSDATIDLHRFTRVSGAPWAVDGKPWPATLGHAGLGWGRGLHGAGAPQSMDGPVKREGDGKSPAGVFAIGSALGYAKGAPADAAVPYQPLSDSWRCVDDPASAFYNRVLDETGIEVDWKSAETMRRNDELYRWVILIDHNNGLGTGDKADPKPTAGDGSCIFFHVWREPGGKTVGCTAMAKPAIEDLMVWLDPKSEPVLVALPRPIYESVREAWGLPTLQ